MECIHWVSQGYIQQYSLETKVFRPMSIPEGGTPCPRAAGPRAWRDARGSQDKRIRKPKLEKGKKRKLKRKEKKRKQIQFHPKY